MHLKLIRNIFTKETTIGDLYIDGKFFCHTLESVNKNLNQNDSLFKIKFANLFKPAAIPTGIYKIDINLKNNSSKLLPEILNVKGEKSVIIHKYCFISPPKKSISIGYKIAHDSLFTSKTIEQDLVDLLLNDEVVTLEITTEDTILNEFNKL